MTTNLYDTIVRARNKHDKSTLHNLKCSIYFLTPELSLVNNNPTAPSSNLKVQLREVDDLIKISNGSEKMVHTPKLYCAIIIIG